MVGRQAGADNARRLTLAAFYGVGSLLCLLTGLTPGWAASGQHAIVAVAVITAAVTGWLLHRRTLPLIAARVLLVTGSVLIAGLTAVSGGGAASVSYAMFTIWVATYAFLFFPTRTAWWQCTAALLAVTVAQVVVYPWPSAGVNAAMVAGVVLTAGCVTDQLVRRLSRTADTDPLTGLLTENGLLGTGWQRAAPIHAVQLFQVQNLPSIRAATGPAGRDELLQELAQRLQHAVNDAALLAHLNGELFAVALTTAPAAVIADTDVIRTALQGVYRIQGLDVDVSVTAGVSHTTADEQPLAVLLTRATQALTAAAGDNRPVRLWTADLDTDATAEINLSTDLRRGIAAGELTLLYQPQVNAHSTVMTGVEALVRWQHPTRGLLGPAVFLPLAETGPLIVDLTYWVLNDAIRQAAHWYRHGHDLPVSVNLSPRLLVHDGLTDDITQLLTRHELPARLLTLEVTETAVLTQPERSREVLTTLREQGIRISLDDFGTGYTSLAMLADLPLDEIKLDRQFVSRAREHLADAAITQAVASLGQRMHLQLVAEGVEDEPTGRLIAEWGYDTIQGFLHSRPVPAGRIDELLSNRNKTPTDTTTPTIPDESDRVAATRGIAAAKFNDDPFLQQITTLAVMAIGGSHAFISLIDADHQISLAGQGLDIATLPRDQSFCAHTITTHHPLVIPDASTDPRFATNPMVTMQPAVRFYAGAPLITTNGHVIGTICVFDTTPRTLTDAHITALRSLATMTTHHLEQQRNHLLAGAAISRHRP